VSLLVAQKKAALARFAVGHYRRERTAAAAEVMPVGIAVHEKSVVAEAGGRLDRRIAGDLFGGGVPVEDSPLSIDDIQPLLHVVEQRRLQIRVLHRLQ